MNQRFVLFKNDQIWILRTPAGVQCFFDADPARFPFCEPVGGGVSAAQSEEAPVPDAEPVGLRSLFDLVPPEQWSAAGLGRQLLHWSQTHRFCGVCGTPTARHPTERAMACPACGYLAYPRINPVVITRVARENRILLVHKAGGILPFWSLVAGFVEAHETLEHAVQRELAEEVGIRVSQIRYASCQAWPFANNLMIGFNAEYESGDLQPDGVEISEAGWFGRDELPKIPSRVSIARQLIDAFFAGR